jgi:TolA-binding protein
MIRYFRKALVQLLFAAVILIQASPLPAQEESGNDPALKDYYLGNGSYNRKLYAVAINYYEAFLKNHGEHPKADLGRRGLALSFYALKQYEKAMPHLTALLAKDKLDAAISRERLIMLQGQCMMLTDKKDDAKKLFVAEIDNLKDETFRAGALAAICDVSFGKSAWEDVASWSGKLLAAKPTPEQSARGHYQQGYALYQLKKTDEAIAVLGKIGAIEADKLWKTRADYLLGECHNLKKAYDKAEAAFLAAQPGLTGKEASECRYRLGLTRFILKKYKEAAADLAAFLADAKDSPREPQAKLYIARSKLELKAFDDAEALLSGLSSGSDEIAAQASLWLARVKTRKSGDFAAAAKALEAAVAKFKDSSLIDDLQFDYANALMAREEPDWQAALVLLQGIEARGKFGQMADLLSQRAVCQHKLGDYAGSLASNDAFLGKYADGPLAADALFMRAENLMLLKRLDEAGQAYRNFVAKHPDHGNALAANFRLVQIFHIQGKWAECLAIAAPMLEKKPSGKLLAQLPFIVGDCQFRQEKWAEAIQSLRAFLAPRLTSEAGMAELNVDTALMQTAVAQDRLKQKDEALKSLAILVDKISGKSPQLPLALAERGRLAFEQGDLKLARKALEQFLSADSKDAEPFKKGAPLQRARVNYYLGWVEADEGKHEQAAQRFGEVLKSDANHPLAPDAALQQGVAWVNSGNFDAAAKHFPEMLARYPQHEKLSRVVYYAGLALARKDQWDAAKIHFKRIAEQFDKAEFADQALYEWAWCERRAKRNEEAIKIYDQLLSKHAESPLAVKVQSELAELNLESGAQDKVIANLTKTLGSVKDAALREDIRYQLASAHFSKGDHKTAAKQFEQLLEDYPKSKLRASMLFQAGESRMKLGEAAAARAHFAKAAAAPGVPEGLAESITMRLAETEALTNQFAAARKSYAAFLEKFPKSRWTRNARFGLAFAMESGGESEDAIPEYQKLLADQTVDLWTVRGRFQLGECYFNLKKYEQAVGEFVQVEINYKQYPDWQAKAVLEMARVLIAQNKKDQAAERLKDLITRYPKEKAATLAQQYLDELRSK